MKHLIAGAVLALGMAGGMAGGALADPVFGTWKTSEDEGSYGHVEFAPCGAAICGTLTRTFNASGEYKSPNIGKTLFIDMVPKGDGTYSGKAWRPANGKTYKGSMTLNGNTLKAGGCVAVVICIKNDLTRVN